MRSGLPANAFWSVVNGGSGAILAVLLPAFLTRQLSPDTFGAWALALQIAGYVNLLGFGAQTVVSRYVAVAHVKEDPALRDKIVSTSFFLLAAAGLLGLLGVCLFALRLDSILPDFSRASGERVDLMVLLLGASLAILLPTSALSAVFIGLQWSKVPALNLVITRILLSLAVILAAVSTRDVVVMGLAYFAVTIAGAMAQWALWKRLISDPRLSIGLVSARTARRFVDECAPFAVWYFSMLLITGLDLVIVARFDHAMVPYYAAAATLVMFVNGIMQAVCSASLPVAARLVAEEKPNELNALVHRVTRISIWLGWLMAAPLIVCGEFVLRLWVGESYAKTAAPFLVILVLANAVRMSVLPFVLAVTAAGLQRKLIVTPLIEGAVKITASLILCQYFGALGVALGTLLGSVVGTVGVLWQHSRWPILLQVPCGAYTASAVWRSGRVLLVALALLVIPAYARNSLIGVPLVLALCLVAGWSIALHRSDRTLILTWLRGILREI